MTKTYKGIILEGRWECIERKPTSMYVFENIYNHNTIEMSDRQIKNVINGRDTIGHIISRRHERTMDNIFLNNVQKSWRKQKHKYAK